MSITLRSFIIYTPLSTPETKFQQKIRSTGTPSPPLSKTQIALMFISVPVYPLHEIKLKRKNRTQIYFFT